MNFKNTIRYMSAAICFTVLFTGGFTWWSEQPKTNADRWKKAAGMYEDYKKSFPEVPDISAADAMKRMAGEPIVFIDVRDPEEQAVSMVAGAVTDRQFMENPGRYRGRTAVAYCTIGYRSGKLAQKLSQQGIRVLNLKAGILGWLHAGGKLHSQGKPVKKVHVYGRKWDLAPLDYQSEY